MGFLQLLCKRWQQKAARVGIYTTRTILSASASVGMLCPDSIARHQLSGSSALLMLLSNYYTINYIVAARTYIMQFFAIFGRPYNILRASKSYRKKVVGLRAKKEERIGGGRGS